MKAIVLLVCALLIADALATDINRIGAGHRRRRRALDTKALVADVFTGYMDEEVTYTLQNVIKAAKAGAYAGVIVVERNSIATAMTIATPIGKEEANPGKAVGWLLQRPTCATYAKSDAQAFAYIPRFTAKDPALVKADAPTLGYKFTYDAAPTKVCGKEAEPKGATKTVLDNLKKAFEDTFNSEATRTKLHNAWLEAKSTAYPIAKSKMSSKGFDDSPNKAAPAPIIFSFGEINAASDKPLAIVIRAFEMGLNPGAVEPSLTLALNALSAAKVKEINFFAIGAGGAASAKDCAGTLNFLQASWYAGVLVNAHNVPTLTISYDQVAGGKAVTTVERELEAVPAAAEPKNNPSQVGDKFDARSKAEAKAFAGEADIVRSFETAFGDDAKIGMTYTFFGGWKSKMSSNLMSGHSANMEDYHVLKTIINLQFPKPGAAAAPKLNKEGVWRVDADPYCIKQTHSTAVNAALTTAKTTPQDMLAIFKWNFAGLPLDQARAGKACWSVTENQAQDFIKSFIPVAADPTCVLDPFAVELAVDFWGDGLKDMKTLTGSGDFGDATKRVFDAAPEARDDLLKTAILGYCKAAWGYMATADATGSDTVKALAGALGKPEARSVAKAAFDAPSPAWDTVKAQPCPMWARDGWAIYLPEKGGKIKVDNAAPKMWFAHWMKDMNGSGVDRLLYKSSNFPGIENLNAKLFDGGKTPADNLGQAKLASHNAALGCEAQSSSGCPKWDGTY